MVRGSFRGKDAWLKIIFDPRQYHEPSVLERVSRNRRLRGRGVRPPRLFASGETKDGFVWFVTEDVGDERIIGDPRYLGAPVPTPAERASIARTFWIAAAAFRDEVLKPPSEVRRRTVAEWVEESVGPMVVRAAGEGVLTGRNRVLSSDNAMQALEVLHSRAKALSGFTTHFSQKHFIDQEVRLQGDVVVLVSWRRFPAEVPFMYEAAVWWWNATLYSWETPHQRWLAAVQEFERVLIETIPREKKSSFQETPEELVRDAFRLCLLERMLGAILIDIGVGGGVPAALGLTEEQTNQVLKNAQAIQEWTMLKLKSSPAS